MNYKEITLTKEEAEALEKALQSAIREAENPVGGENCRAMEHGVVVDCDGNRRYFLHADNEKLKKYEEAEC